MQFGKEFRGLCPKPFTNVINGQIRDREKRNNVQRWERGARTAVFRSGLRRITDAARRGTNYPQLMQWMIKIGDTDLCDTLLLNRQVGVLWIHFLRC